MGKYRHHQDFSGKQQACHDVPSVYTIIVSTISVNNLQFSKPTLHNGSSNTIQYKIEAQSSFIMTSTSSTSNNVTYSNPNMGDVFKVYGYSDSSNNKLWTVFCETKHSAVGIESL